MTQLIRTIFTIILFYGFPFCLIADGSVESITNIDTSNPHKITFLLDMIECLIVEKSAKYSLPDQLSDIRQAESIIRELIFQQKITIWNSFLDRYKYLVGHLNKDDLSPYENAYLDPEYYSKNKEYFALDGPVFTNIRNDFFDFKRQYFFSPNRIYINFNREKNSNFGTPDVGTPIAPSDSLVSYFEIAIDTANKEMTVFSVNGK